MGEDFFSLNLFAVEIEKDKVKIKPGLPNLHTVKLSWIESILDNTVNSFLKTSDKIENLELAGCKSITEFII